MLESWHVVLRWCARLFLAGGAMTYSALAPALGLGDITVHSALDQPFRADIALVDAAGLEEGDLSVSLATAAQFSRAGVERVFFLNDLKFTPVLHGDRSLIRVSSSKAVNEPFLNFLVQLNQPNGQVLREYTVLIDPPGTPGIVPVTDEPGATSPGSPFPSVKPATVPPPAKKPAAMNEPAAAPPIDPVAEQLAASVLQNQQLQKTVEELNARLLAQDAQVAGQNKQITELQTRLAEVQQAAAVPAEAVAPAAITTPEPEAFDWPLFVGVPALIALLLLGLFLRRRRQQLQPLPETPTDLARHEPVLDPFAEPAVKASPAKPVTVHHDETPSGDVLEGVGIYLAYGRFAEAAGLLREALAKEPQRTDLAVQLLDVLGKQGDRHAYDAQESSLREGGFDPQQLQELRGRHPKLHDALPMAAVPAAVPAAVTAVAAVASPEPVPDHEFQLNLDELSMDSSWDLVSPFETARPLDKAPEAVEPEFTSNLHVLPDVFEMPEEPTLGEPELEWMAEPDAQSLDDDFLNEFGDVGQSFELEPLSVEPEVSSHAGKLEQAQNCIDDGDLDSAVELLNELVEDGDERLRQTARTLLAGIG